MPRFCLHAVQATVLTGAAFLSTSVVAQEVAAIPDTAGGSAEADGAGDGGENGDILVTARRRTERSQDVPIAINAFGAAQIEATRTFNLRDLQQLTPSLVVTNTNPRNTSINIRGLGNNVAVYNDGLEPAVGVYLDGVYLARPGQTVFDLADLDRIEVLRAHRGRCSARTPRPVRWWWRRSSRRSMSRRAATSAWATTIFASYTPMFPGR